MGAKTTSSIPFSMLPRLGFSPTHKTGSSSRSPYAENPEEDWYIPYNGPLEPPKSVSMAKQDTMRHSFSQDDVNAFLEDSQLLDRYRDTSVNDAEPVRLGAQSTGFPGPRTRVRSDFTRRTTSSTSVIDSIRPHPRRRQASAPRLQIPTHTMDASAGVGESPMPMQRIAMSSPQKKMGRFFGFGSSKKSKRQSTSTPVSPISRTNMPGTWLPNSVQHSTLQENVNFAKPSGSSPNTGNHFDSPYVTLPRPSRRSRILHYTPRVDVVDPSPSKQHSVRHVDLHGIPDQDSFPSFPTTYYDSPTISMAHPCENTSSVSVSALRPGTSQQSRQGHHQLDSGSQSTHFSHNNLAPRGRTLTYAIDPRSDRAATLGKNARPLTSPLKSSVSTPNLFATSRDKQPSQQNTKSTPPVAGVERWLSPETWCNALFFPRPRLKVKRAHEPHGGSSGRILSPPITPVAEGATPRLSPALLGGRPQISLVTTDALKEHHTLLKSRSAVDVLSGPSISSRPRTAPMQPCPDPIEGINLEESESVPAASTAQQELRPSTPVPSLTQVLEEGEVLEEQRRQWQHQASHSFGNSRTRSLSRARARSLSRCHGHKPEGSTTLEYLAARTLLGSQSISPTVNVARTSHSRSHSHSHTASSFSRGRSSSYSFTRSHSHSLGKSNSQRSLTDPQPQSTRHARNDSWGKTALLKACAPCGDLSDLLGTHVENKKPALEPMTEETKVIHLTNPADPSHNEADEGGIIVIGVSPAPTTPSGEGVGIALSSPPPSDDRFCLDHELPSMPSHPYATGAIYTRYPNPSSEHGLQHDLKVSDYAGPHPSAYDPQLPSNTAITDVSMRHRLPPRAMQPGVILHPYAAALSEPVNSHARQPSNSVPPTLPVPPSAVQEDDGFTSGNHISISSPDLGKYGVGEVLVFAAPSRDEQETDSEDQSFGTIIPCQQDTLSRIIDKGKAKDSTPVPMTSNNGRSRMSGSDSVVVSTRPPSLISVTAMDSTHSHGTTTNITSAHLVISALDNDDLDEFQDLFYRPPQSRLSSEKSSVKHQDASETSRGIPSDIHSSYSGSALTNLMRSMSEIGELHVATSDLSHGQRSGGPGDQRSDELSQTYVFMDMSRTPSPVQVDPCAVTQVQLYEAPFEASIPEDIESSRASSPMIASQENDTFGHPIRQDVVDAAGKSTIHQGSRRTSAYASIHDAAEEVDLVSPISFVQSPPLSADTMRSSYMTSGSEYSRMSTLSDFPDPPGAQPNQPSILQIYVDPPTPHQQSESFGANDCPQSGSRVFSLESHHTTFGGSDDMDIITRVHRSEL